MSGPLNPTSPCGLPRESEDSLVTFLSSWCIKPESKSPGHYYQSKTTDKVKSRLKRFMEILRLRLYRMVKVDYYKWDSRDLKMYSFYLYGELECLEFQITPPIVRCPSTGHTIHVAVLSSSPVTFMTPVWRSYNLQSFWRVSFPSLPVWL